eukprot:s216_g1.t1
MLPQSEWGIVGVSPAWVAAKALISIPPSCQLVHWCSNEVGGQDPSWLVNFVELLCNKNDIAWQAVEYNSKVHSQLNKLRRVAAQMYQYHFSNSVCVCAPLQLLWLKGIGALETNFNGAARISPELLGASCRDGQEG